MLYEPLFKLYYKNQKKWLDKYNERFNFEFTERIKIKINEYNYQESYESFFCYSAELSGLIQEIEDNKVRLLNLIDYLPRVMYDNISQIFMIHEIQATNKIEGIHSSRKELQNALLRIDEKSIFRYKSILIKYNKLLDKKSNINFITCNDLRNFYNEFVLDEISKEEYPDGKFFRKSSVDVITGTGKVLHRGKCTEDLIIHDMNIALEFLNNPKFHYTIRAAIFHYLFGYIHPFYDGNGRTARFISSYLLAKEIHPLVGLRLSVIIKNNIDEYNKLFIDTNSNINRGDLTFFLLSFLRLFNEATKNTIDILSKRYMKLDKYQALLDVFLENNKIKDLTIKNIYGILLQSTLFSINGGITRNELATSLEKSRNTVDSRLKKINDTHYKLSKKNKIDILSLNMDILTPSTNNNQ